MDAIIKFSSAEFNLDLFKKTASLVKGNDTDITIAVRTT